MAAVRLVEVLLCTAEMHGIASTRRGRACIVLPHALAHGAVYGGGLFEAFVREMSFREWVIDHSVVFSGPLQCLKPPQEVG